MALDLSDKTGNGNTLTNVNRTEETSSLPFAGSTIAVDLESGSSAYLYAADSVSLSITQSFTLEAWVNFESTPSSGNSMVIAAKYRDDTNNRSWVLWLQNIAGNLNLVCYYSDDGTAQDAGAVTWTPSTGTWYHVALVYNHTTPKLQFSNGISCAR